MQIRQFEPSGEMNAGLLACVYGSLEIHFTPAGLFWGLTDTRVRMVVFEVDGCEEA